MTCSRRLAVVISLCSAVGIANAQSRLPSIPGYERYDRLRKEIPGSVRYGALSVMWIEGGKAFEYSKDGKGYRYAIAARTAVEVETPVERPPANRIPRTRPARGRQYSAALSPDKQWKAFYRDRNLWLSRADGSNETAITLDGAEQWRTKYGTASWVYGEELDQLEAMWWSPDSKKIAYYRFDEMRVHDYYLTLKTSDIQDTLDVEPYPKAGAPNPIVDLYIYDLDSKRSVRVDVRDGKPFDDAVVGHYVYNVRWSPDGKELLFNRTNRRQNVMEFAASEPGTGKCRVILREEWPASWTENNPPMQFLKDGKRFILASERTGWRNLYLYDLSGRLLRTLTDHRFEVEQIVRVDEKDGTLYYMARSGDNHLKRQLHRVGLDGGGDRRLTDPAYDHSVDIAPDGRYFIDVAQTHDAPPVTRLVDADGKIVATLAESDLNKFNALGLQKTELLTFKAADGKTVLYGSLQKPSGFDPARKYPLLVRVYAGPESASLSERFTTPDPITELGFLVAAFDGRGTVGRGKRFKDEMYLKLGRTEIDDQAEGVKFLRQRPYVDGARVGISGGSYGGYASVMCLLRYPDVFQAACASSSVTDWRNYDSIYTERYMWIPQENKDGYEAGSAMTYARNLKGSLMLFFGTADNNVHPSNTYQLISALQRAGKSFEVQVGPDMGHGGLGHERMLEFFMENLALRPSAAETPVTGAKSAESK